MPKESKDVKAMADLLRQGATLTEHACPACSSPLFKLKSGDLWCAKCKKRVVIVEEGAQPTEVASPVLLNSLESTILAKIGEVNQKIREETDIERLQKLNDTLSMLLENLQRVRRIKRQ
jgi:UPF0148 protein